MNINLHICIFCSSFYRSMYIFISTYLSFCQGDPLQDEGHEPQRLRRSLQNLHRDPPQEYNRRMKNKYFSTSLTLSYLSY